MSESYGSCRGSGLPMSMVLSLEVLMVSRRVAPPADVMGLPPIATASTAPVSQRTYSTKVARLTGLNLQFARPYVCTFEPERASPRDRMCE